MKVILSEDVKSLGRLGETVNVKPGFARNFLIPRGKAMMASANNKAALEHKVRVLEKRRDKEVGIAKELASKIEKASVTVTKQVGEDERIFGSVTSAELEQLLNQDGIEVSKKDIEIVDEIKKVGVYTARVKLHPEVDAKFKVWVVAQ